ncbi:DMT family transporter [Pendulispora albinea]|uniref:DMT family transporter n=1 Tax=Pendulispora albinea TaxID=2741071 RepID=A0ABZ2LXH2_9BACT
MAKGTSLDVAAASLDPTDTPREPAPASIAADPAQAPAAPPAHDPPAHDPAQPSVATSARERQGAVFMILGGALLGTVGVFVEEAGQHPFTAVWFRCVFGAAALFAWGLARGRARELWLDRRGLGAALLAGALMTANWALFFAALEHTSIAVATVVFHVQPLWLMAAGVLWLGEPFSRLRAGAALLALIGLTLATGLLDGAFASGANGIAGAAETNGTGASPAYVGGLAMCLAASLAYTGVSLIAKTVRRVSSFALAWWQCVVGAVLLGWWPLAHGLPRWGTAWAWLTGLGVLHTGLAYVLLYVGMSRLPAGRIAILQFVYPACAVAVDWLVYGRALSAAQLSGVVLIGVAQWGARAPRATR